ncbi:aminotransferase class I/II-fold pyridoxal phosphate-dependent enzyme [Halospina sp. K52047b]|uniref:aminotransferase class I/II-fold pyridoxal phosphate-dependent enzyme n=1 Tax=Halospina sp. K52047b TaxID=2614160 RepID=UPI001787B607|nr:aminotransferase class I/II-fold pyridoxal phosphate-dependent enzyme [Halospina sp. K52047b]
MVKNYLRGHTAVNIATSIEQAIRSGKLGANDGLPSVREAAQTLGVNRNTVSRAYAMLRERGWVYGRGRGGTRIVPMATEADMLYEPGTSAGTVDLASGNIDPALLPSLDAVVASMSWLQTGYDRAGEDPQLMDQFRAILAHEGIPAEALVLGHSALDLIERALRPRLPAAGARVLVEDPGWPPLLTLLRSLGFTPEPVKNDEHGVDPDALARQLAPDVCALVLTPRAQNPTGVDLPAERLAHIQRLIGSLPEILLVLDDHWGPLSLAPPPTLALDQGSWILVRSVSKFLGPDLRLAAAVGDRETIDRIARQFSLGPRWISRIVQRIASVLLGDEQTFRHLERAKLIYAQRREALAGALRHRGVPVVEGSGINLWVPVRDEAAMVECMANRGYAIQAGQPFRLRTGPGVRLSVGSLDRGQADTVAQTLVDCMRGPVSPMV